MKHNIIQTSRKFSIFIVLMFNLTITINSYNYAYTRVNECVLQTLVGCVYWQSLLQFQKKLDASCFPEQTYLQGRNSKIKISELKVGDQVLVYEQNQVKFQKVQAWLHRQVDQQFQYRFIRYQIRQHNSQLGDSQVMQNGIYISGMHNIAIEDDQSGKIKYDFAQNLKQNDLLFGHGPYFSSQSPKVSQISTKLVKRGIYAPYTRSGNYFIASSQNFDQLILVHCFAHVSTKYHLAFDFLINLYSPWNIQPSQSSYIHPLSSLLKDFFPSVIEIKTLNKMAKQLSRRHNEFNYWDSDSQFRATTHGTQRRDFKQERKIMVIIDKIFSTIQITG